MTLSRTTFVLTTSFDTRSARQTTWPSFDGRSVCKATRYSLYFMGFLSNTAVYCRRQKVFAPHPIPSNMIFATYCIQPPSHLSFLWSATLLFLPHSNTFIYSSPTDIVDISRRYTQTAYKIILYHHVQSSILQFIVLFRM